MDCLVSEAAFTEGDAEAFTFESAKPFEICAILVQRSDNGQVDFHKETLDSEDEYEQWIKRVGHLMYVPVRCGALIRMNSADLQRIAHANPHYYSSFTNASIVIQDLCQHRTLAWLLFRVSTAVFSNRFVTWEHSHERSPSMVYHCKSDTASLHDGNDVVLSTTCFLDKPLTLAIMYGCTEEIIGETAWWLKRCASSAFHPLILPMIFADIERSRFLDALDLKATELEGRILELESRVKKETTQEPSQEKPKTDVRKTMTERDCYAIHLCRSVTSLKNGLVSLVTELGSMRDHLQALPNVLRDQVADITIGQRQVQEDGAHIDAKLKAMIAELQSKIRTCEGHLGAMTMATQMEWNYYTRRDAQVNYSIATAARKDGSQMKQISRLGMVFLPGTFLATFFSMTFFSWLPQDSSQVTSPWLALYFGATALVTAVTVVWLERRSTREMETAKADLQQELDRDTDSTLFSRLTFSRSSSFKARDVESGAAS